MNGWNCLMNRRRFATLAATPLITGTLIDRAAAQGTPIASPSASPGASPVASPGAGIAIPNTPVGQQLAWVIGVINQQHGVMTVDEIKAHVSPAVLSKVPEAELQTVVKQLAAQLGTVILTGFATPPTDTQAVALIDSKAGIKLQVQIAVDAAPPHLIEGLLFQPAQQAAPATPVAVGSWSELDQKLTALAPAVNLLVAELVKGKIKPVHTLNAARPQPLGSTFKLYILGDLAHQIDQGKMSWNDELAIRDDWKSLPSGDMRNEPAGTKFTLLHYAEQMISVSDNTAADHLLFHLGRENVEGFQSGMGNSNASLNDPFLATRELFVLKLAFTADEVAMYLAAGRDQRRELLDTKVDKTPVTLQEAANWKNPRYVDRIEWFASPQDLARAMMTLQGMWSQKGLEPLKHVLSINPGVNFDAKVWPYIGYKGGSEPGVLNLTWLLQRHDERWFVVTAGFMDTKEPLDENAAILTGAAAVNFAAGVQ